MKTADFKIKIFEMMYECENYKYIIIREKDINPKYDKDLDDQLKHYDGFDHALSSIISAFGLEDSYRKYANHMDKMNGYKGIDSLPKMDNLFDVPDNLK